MRKLLTLVLALFLFGFAVVSATEVKASGTLSATITGIFEGSESFSLTPTGLTLGSNVSFDLNGKPSGQEFAFWILNGIVRKDLPANHNFPVTGRMQLQVVFAPTGKYAVVFINSSGQYLGVRYAGSNNSFTVDPSEINIPVKPGFELKAVENRWLSIEGSTSFTGVNEHSVFVVQYNPTTTFDDVAITVNNGSLSGSYTFNSVLTVTASTPAEGQYFAGWIENDILISYDSEYTFTVLFPRTLTAIYDSEEPVVQPIVHISNDLELRGGYHTFIGQFEIPAGYTLLEYGFLAHADALWIDHSTTNVVIAQSGSVSDQNEFVTSFPIGQYYSFVAYLVLYNSNTSEYESFYSQVNHRYVDYLKYQFDFGTTQSASYLDTNYSLTNLVDSSTFTMSRKRVSINDELSTTDPVNRSIVISPRIGDNDGISWAEFKFDTPVTKISFESFYWNSTAVGLFTTLTVQAKINGVYTNIFDLKEFLGGALTRTYTEIDFLNYTDIRIYATGGANNSNNARVLVDNLKAYSVFTGEVRDVSIDRNNSQPIETLLVPYGGLLTQPATPIKVGYSFAGWYSNAELTNIHNFSGQVTGNFTIYAKWTPTNNTITYNLDGGTNDGSNPSSYTIESSTITLQPATKDYYTFNGWYDNPGFTGSQVTQITSGSTTNVVLYAKFTPISYSITYNLDGGINNESNPISYDVEDSFNLLAATKEGYTFGGWYDNSEFSGTAITEVALGTHSNITLYAKFTISSGATYSVFFYDGATPLDEVEVIEGNLVEPMDPVPTKNGYTFNSWVTTNGGSTGFVFENPINGDTNIYAKWDLNNYTITYNLDSGTNSVNNPASYTIETPTITLEDASRSGHTFNGWFSDSGFETEVTTIVLGSTGNVTLYASFTSSGTFATDLFISEYIEGAPGNRKAVEIYNGTGATINLSIYRIKLGVNGAAFSTDPAVGIALNNYNLPHGSTYVVYYDDSTLNDKLGPYGNQESTSLNFNGDDAIGLFKNNVLVDVFGTPGTDPGNGWTLNSLANATVDSVIIRKSTVQNPSTTWDPNEWTRLSAYVDGTSGSTTLGNHTYNPE